MLNTTEKKKWQLLQEERYALNHAQMEEFRKQNDPEYEPYENTIK